MAAVSGHIQNLINGVSEQPAAVRLPTQVEAQVNGFSTVSAGLRKRPPTIHKAFFTGFPASAASYHTINRDANERYKVAFHNGGIHVVDFAGNAKTVSFPNGTGYLSASDPAASFQAFTEADYTFLLNREVTVAKAATTAPSRNPEALIHVYAAGYGKTYNVWVNDALVASCATPNDYETNVAAANAAARATTTANIAEALYDGYPAENMYPGDSGGFAGNGLTMHLTAPEWQVTRYDNVLHIVNTLGNDFTVRTESDGEKSSIRAHKDVEAEFADLPNKGPDGFVIKISSNKESPLSDYFVRFKQTATSGEKGSWKETVAPGIQVALDPATMPHALVREADGTFTFKALDWSEREVGDETSAPWPSFVGKAIRAVTFFRNRLGFTADENVVMSRAGKFFNLFRETILEELDTDPIDVAATSQKVAFIDHAIPFNKSMILFSGVALSVFTGDELLTPKSAHIDPLAEFITDANVRPVTAGTSLFFTTAGTTSTSVMELVYDDDNNVATGVSKTNAHCPGYLPAGVTDISASSSLNMLVARSPLYADRVYVYKYYWSNDEKVQSSWSYWDLGAQVLDADFVDDELTLVVKRGSYVCFETVPCEESYRDMPPELVVCLDRRLDSADLPRTYDPGTGLTTFTLPYVAAGVSVVDAPGGTTPTGRNYPVVETFGTAAKVAGDLTGVNCYVGFPYTFVCQLSELVARAGSKGEQPVIAGNLTIDEITFFAMSGYFRVEVSQLFRDTYSIPFTGAELGDPRRLVGEPSTIWHSARVPVRAASKEITVKIISDGYLPCAALNADWTGKLTR